MLQKFKITSYAIIFTLAVVFILPVAGEAVEVQIIVEPSDTKNTDKKAIVSGKDFAGFSSDTATFVPKPEDFPNGEWTPKTNTDGGADVQKPNKGHGSVMVDLEPTRGNPKDFPNGEWTPKPFISTDSEPIFSNSSSETLTLD